MPKEQRDINKISLTQKMFLRPSGRRRTYLARHRRPQKSPIFSGAFGREQLQEAAGSWRNWPVVMAASVPAARRQQRGVVAIEEKTERATAKTRSHQKQSALADQSRLYKSLRCAGLQRYATETSAAQWLRASNPKVAFVCRD